MTCDSAMLDHVPDPRPDAATRTRPLWRSRRLHAVLSLGLVGALATGGSWASWSDQGKISGTTLSTGRLDLKLNNNLDDDTGFTAMSLTGMYPGTSAAGTLIVRNAGTVPFTYTVAAAGTNDDSKNLVGSLVAKIALGGLTGTAPTQTCSGTAINGSGTTLSGALIGTTIKRTLAAGASETLCVQASLPTTAATGVQSATTALTFTLVAEQIQ